MKVLVTGGHGGIGKSIVQQYIELGYLVFAPKSTELNLSSEKSIKKYLSNNKDFDIYIHCAGINNPELFEQLDLDNVYRTLQINTLSSLEILKFILPYMKENHFGRIVNISSLWSIKPKSGRIAYSLSKSALDALTRGIAIEYGSSNILINSVLPGFIDTPLTRKNLPEETIENIVENTPINRLGKPEDISKIVYFLGSESNNFITGQSIIADGGYTL